MGIYNSAQAFKEGLKSIPHIEPTFDSCSHVIAFQSRDLDIFKISEAMSRRGWHLNNLQRPSRLVRQYAFCVMISIQLPSLLHCKSHRQRARDFKGPQRIRGRSSKKSCSFQGWCCCLVWYRRLLARQVTDKRFCGRLCGCYTVYLDQRYANKHRCFDRTYDGPQIRNKDIQGFHCN